MASRTRKQKHVDNTTTETLRSIRQGAPCKPDELKEVYTVTIHMTKAEYERFIVAKGFMKNSAFGRLVLFLGLENYLNQVIA